MPSQQVDSPEAIYQALGISGYSGITAAADGTTASTLDITVSAGAWAILKDGTVLRQSTGQLVTASVAGNTVNGSYTLYLDYTWGNTDVAPTWSVAASAPSANAIALAAVTVSGNVISAVTMNPTGPSFPLSGASTTTAPAAGGAGALPATPLGYLSVSINGTVRHIAYYA